MDKNSKKELDQDACLMLQTSSGDLAAFEKLYRKYFQTVISYLAKLDGYQGCLEDLAQEVFVRTWRNRNSFRAKSTCKTYLLGIAKNVMLEERRHLWKNRIKHQGLAEYYLQTNSSCVPDDITSQKELIVALTEALDRLTPKQQQAVRLFHIEGKSLNEAAAQVDCTVDAFQNRLFRARRKLQNAFKRYSK